MLPLDIVIEVDAREFDAAIGRITALGRDASPVMGLIAGLMMDAVESNFEAEGRPKWMGLRPSTLREKRKAGGVNKILQRDGRLASSIQSTHDAKSATVGTNVVYAAIHQFGGTIERHPMSGHVRLRTDRHGSLMRQADHPNLAVFAKGGHKQVKKMRWTRTTGWQIKIPARPFLALSEGDSVRIETEVLTYLRSLVSE